MIAFAVSAPALADKPRLRATRVMRAPVLDGVLDDDVWKLAVPTDSFLQKFPDAGQPPSERTTLRVLYDDHALYVGFECTQTKSPIVRRLTRRDRWVEADSVSFAIDSRRDGTSAFEFSVNAAGVLSDGVRFNDTDYTSDWDENWDARVALRSDGWSAEVRIPLRVLRFDDDLPVQEWGFQARRYISARQETDEWSYIPRTVAGEVSNYGRLGNLSDLKPGAPLELRPFAVMRVRRRDAGSGVLASGTDLGGSGGLDLKWHVTQQLTLDAAFNPDFGQVEADQVVFNLSTYEIYYPEKRPFFLEGIDTFATPLPVLYTRRIGWAPPAPVLRSDLGEQLIDAPSPSTIYGATKLVGTVGAWTVGLLTAVTGSNAVGVQAPGGAASRLADATGLFNVVRLKLAVSGNSHIGFIATTSNRFEPAGGYPAESADPSARELCPGGEAQARGGRCFRDSYVSGIDWRWRSSSGDYAVSGQAIASIIENGPARTLLDGTVLRPGDASWGGQFYVAKEGGTPWVWGGAYEGEGQKLDFNDLGYMQRQNIHRFSGFLEYRTMNPWRSTIETHTRFDFYDRESLGGLNLGRGYALSTNLRFNNFWGFYAGVHYRPAYYDDRETGDGTALQHEGLFGLELRVSSDPRERVSGDLFAQAQQRFNGSYLYVSGRLSFRVLEALELDVLPEATYTSGEPRYVGAGPVSGEYLFGNLLGRSVGTTLRATYTFTPRLSLQVYTQLFLGARHYAAFTSIASDPSAARPIVHLRDLQPAAGPPSNADSEEGVLNVNVVIRWEYVLGSTLYLVYSRSQAPNAALASGQMAALDLGAIPRAPAVDAVLFKLSYFWR
jgi:hypothetical protein